MTPTECKQMAKTQVQKQNGFWVHLAVFLVVNAGLITLNTVRSPDKIWFHWVLIGWGAGLLLNGFCVFTGRCAKNCNIQRKTER